MQFYNDAWTLGNGVTKVYIRRFSPYTPTQDGIDFIFTIGNDAWVICFFSESASYQNAKLLLRKNGTDLWIMK